MHVTPPLPLLKRVPPGVWTALAWCAATAYSFLTMVVLPGEAVGGLSPTRRGWGGMPYGNQLNLALGTALALAGSCLLRRRPLTAVALLLTASVAGAMALNSSEINLLQILAADVALCFVAARRARRTSVAALALTLGVLVGYAVTRLLLGFGIGTSTLLAMALTAVVAWLVGNSARQSRAYASALGAQAATQAVTAERLRIARELHDMVAHSIGIIALQAGAATRVIETQPVRAREALREVEMAGRETLSGLRRMLGALREGEVGGGTSPYESGVVPGLGDVERLAAVTTAAGVRVDVSWRGERRPLPPEIDVSAYRIIQESVTNVVRHAGVGSCEVVIDSGEEAVVIEVGDRGRGVAVPPVPGCGFGLVGMRERVALLRGEFSAVPRVGGGFVVRVRLPVAVGVGVR
ncbi:sensor histidine kinase [Streptomyces sp. NPDC091292]|uniref:sensor histidine kinase n=1 Tax=Streptomyces sp. NPDC091292 TaxID=3365991 RepID=UPI0037F32DB4